MAIHFCSHAWEVRDTDAGTMVALSNRDLTADAIPVLADELFEIARESDHPNIILDFERIGLVSSGVVAKMVVLDNRLCEIGGRLSALNVNPALYDLFARMKLIDVIAIQRR